MLYHNSQTIKSTKLSVTVPTTGSGFFTGFLEFGLLQLPLLRSPGIYNQEAAARTELLCETSLETRSAFQLITRPYI